MSLIRLFWLNKSRRFSIVNGAKTIVESNGDPWKAAVRAVARVAADLNV